MKNIGFAILVGLGPGVVAAQTPVERLQAVLPPAVAADVITVIQDAAGQGLPGEALASRLLEAHAKGKPDSVLSATARSLEEGLGAAREAVRAAGREPRSDEIEAAATARDAGVDTKSISALAASAGSDQSLAVPLVVLAALVNEGVSTDDALKTVEKKLSSRASNSDLTELPGEAEHDSGTKRDHGDAGHALGAPKGGGEGGGGTIGSVSHPARHPDDVPENGGDSGKRPRQHQNAPRAS